MTRWNNVFFFFFELRFSYTRTIVRSTENFREATHIPRGQIFPILAVRYRCIISVSLKKSTPVRTAVFRKEKKTIHENHDYPEPAL